MDGIQKSNKNSSLGLALALKAINKDIESRKKGVADEVSFIIKSINQYKTSIKNDKVKLTYHEHRLQCINAGEFEITSKGIILWNSFFQERECPEDYLND